MAPESTKHRAKSVLVRLGYALLKHSPKSRVVCKLLTKEIDDEEGTRWIDDCIGYNRGLGIMHNPHDFF
jgi:hypothetical protein